MSHKHWGEIGFAAYVLNLRLAYWDNFWNLKCLYYKKYYVDEASINPKTLSLNKE